MQRDILDVSFPWWMMTLNEKLAALAPRRPTIGEIQQRFAYCDWVEDCKRKGRDIIDLTRPLTFAV